MLGAVKPLHRPRPVFQRGLTLVELLIVVALIAVILGLAGPSFTDFIAMQRLRGANGQLVTDLQFARSEAVSRNRQVHLRFQSNAGMSCYIVYTAPDFTAPCDCTAAEGSRCTAANRDEVRTVQIPTSRGVRVVSSTTATDGTPLDRFGFDPRTGGIVFPPLDNDSLYPAEFVVDAFLDTPRKLRDAVSRAGRIKVCTPSGSRMTEAACS